MAMSTRKMLFQGSAVLLAGSLNVGDFLQACREQPVVFEVSWLLLPCRNYAALFVHVCKLCMLLNGSVSVTWSHTYSAQELCAGNSAFAASIPTVANFIRVRSYNLHAIIYDYHHSVLCPQDAVKI